MITFNAETEKKYLHEALGQLKDYLLSDEVYWSLGRDPQLTLGNLLLSQHYLQAMGQLPEAEATRLAEMHEEWKSAWQKKAGREFASRVRLWLQYLQELSDNPRRNAGFFPTDVRHRTVLGLLAAEAPGAGEQLAAPDALLKRLTEPGDFVWDRKLTEVFPQDEFWYLWVSVKR